MGLFGNPLGYAGFPPGATGEPTTQNSTVRAATLDEANDGVANDIYISPATAQAATLVDFASPPALGFGSTTPRPVHATTLDATGTVGINTSGAGVTTIGTGGTGATNIGNATGNTAVTGSLTASTGLVATTGGITATGTSNINTSGAGVTSIGTGGTGATNIGNATGNTAVTGSLTASTGLVATTGGVTASAGNIVATLGDITASAGAVSAGTTLTAGTTITATAGDITATLGHVIINGAAKQLRVHGGAVTDFIGQATLVNGTVTVANTNIAATDRVFVARSAKNASTAYGMFEVTITAATNFVITACKSDTTTETNDVSTVDYFIVRQV